MRTSDGTRRIQRWHALLLAGVLAIAATACGGEATETVTFADRIQADIPADMERQDLQGFDSAVGRWSNGELELTYDIGRFSDPLGYGDRDEFRISLLTISDRSATIEYFYDTEMDSARPWIAALHIPDLGNGDALTMYVHAADEDGQDAALRIFRSLKVLDDAS
jgi:hypothetical protein